MITRRARRLAAAVLLCVGLGALAAAPAAGAPAAAEAYVRLAHLSQDTAEIPGHLRVLESLEAVRATARLGDGREISAGMLCDRFGFRGERARDDARARFGWPALAERVARARESDPALADRLAWLEGLSEEEVLALLQEE